MQLHVSSLKMYLTCQTRSRYFMFQSNFAAGSILNKFDLPIEVLIKSNNKLHEKGPFSFSQNCIE